MEYSEETAEKGLTLLNKCYDMAMNGVIGSKSVVDLANDYLIENDGNREKAIDSLVRWQIRKCTLSGVATGFGGFITSAVTIPANMVSVTYMQIRMIAAIAHLRGYDLKSDQVQSMVYCVLVGESFSKAVSEFGKEFAVKSGQALLKRIPGEVFKQINKWLGFRFITKGGTKGMVNLGKLVPFLGCFVGGTIDLIQTNVLADLAREEFKLLPSPESNDSYEVSVN